MDRGNRGPHFRKDMRSQIFKRDRGICALCGVDCIRLHSEACVAAFGRDRRPNINRGYGDDPDWEPWSRECYKRGMCPKRRTFWEVDHIIAYADGGRCVPENLRTLCHPCHVIVTRAQTQARVEARG